MADTTVRTYNPNSVAVTFGTAILTGYAENTFVKITRNGDLFEKVKGADGGIDRVNKNSTDFTVEVTLKQTSPSNDALSIIVTEDIISNTGVLPLNIADGSGTTLFSAPQAWVSKDPDDEFGNGLTDRTWTFHTGASAKLTGGNS